MNFFIKSSSLLLTQDVWPKKSFQLPKLQIHRGYHLQQGVQENTIEAFQLAAKMGAEICECDVQLSADGRVVVVHDLDISRISKYNLKVCELTALQLKEKANVPTLEELLQKPNLPKYFNIELKSQGINDFLPRYVANQIKKMNKESSVLFSSFNPFSLYILQNLLPDVPRALLVTSENHPQNNFFLKNMLSLPFLRLHALNIQEHMIDFEFMQLFQNKLPICAWTVNDKDRASELLALGVQSIISDRFIFD